MQHGASHKYHEHYVAECIQHNMQWHFVLSPCFMFVFGHTPMTSSIFSLGVWMPFPMTLVIIVSSFPDEVSLLL